MRKRNWLLQKTTPPEPDNTLLEKILKRDALLSVSQYKIDTNPLAYGSEFLPVGDIPFVEVWLQAYYGKPMTPIEVPEVLRTKEYLGRSYLFTDCDRLSSYEHTSMKYFVKNVSKLKEFNSALYDGRIPYPSTLPDGQYLISEWVNIRSEFRVFVYHDEILGVQPYLGSPLAFPNPQKILRMVEDYKKDAKRPGAYTMDVAVICQKDHTVDTVILEVHPFVSCGLYGFCDQDIPNMLEEGLRYYIER